MRASGVLQKCLSESLGGMHALREAVLLRSVQGQESAQAALHHPNRTLRRWPMEPVWNWIRRLRTLPETVFH
ncbi:hypothetical protein HDC36_001781 [Xanthomonas sp. JAI131]|jgi:hypothetical protein|uniref:hypothetical protein n=1 Tax=Xanthomonas sp. JAI131 TaxID=2723067 RepID=UPI0015C77BC7|nr:hypothetical protein [Xanthomonas sp. JAI131]NYF20320.1 hypothetical protein [Xanthomonas sp. JAI131]